MATAITCIEFNECIECIPLGSVPGVNTILVCSRANLGFWYYLESDTLQYNTIIGNELNPNWYTIECKKELTIFAFEQSNLIRRLYNMTLDVVFSRMTGELMDQITQAVMVADLVVIFKDKNGNYWCFGETSGSDVFKYNAGTGVARTGQNQESFQFSCAERAPIRLVDPAYVNALLIQCQPIFPLCAESLDSLCPQSLDDICAAGGTLN